MSSIRSLFGWGLLLSFALFAPISLPAGGSSQSDRSIRRKYDHGPILAGDNCCLRVSPSVDSASLRTLQVGTPISILRIWNSPEGDYWLQVKLNSLEFVDVIGSASRGWINV